MWTLLNFIPNSLSLNTTFGLLDPHIPTSSLSKSKVFMETITWVTAMILWALSASINTVLVSWLAQRRVSNKAIILTWKSSILIAPWWTKHTERLWSLSGLRSIIVFDWACIFLNIDVFSPPKILNLSSMPLLFEAIHKFPQLDLQPVHHLVTLLDLGQWTLSICLHENLD